MCGGGGMLNLDVSGPGAKPKYARLIRYIQSPPHISLTYSLPPFLSVAWSICLVSPISSEGTIQKETDGQRERERPVAADWYLDSITERWIDWPESDTATVGLGLWGVACVVRVWVYNMWKYHCWKTSCIFQSKTCMNVYFLTTCLGVAGWG